MRRTLRCVLLAFVACSQASALMLEMDTTPHRASQQQGPPGKDFVTANARTEAALHRAGDINPFSKEAIILGQGFDVLERHFRNYPAANSNTTASHPDVTANASGQDITYSLRAIENYSKLVSSLNVSAEASLGLLSSSGGSARLEMAKTEMQEENSAYLLVEVQVVNSNTKLASYEFKNDAVRTDADHLDPQSFFDRYGDSFVDSITTGGEFFGLVRFRANNSQERSAIYGQLQLHSGTFKLETKFASELEVVTRGKNVEVVIKKNGGDCAIPPSDKLQEAALQFPGTVAPQTAGKPGLLDDFSLCFGNCRAPVSLLPAPTAIRVR